MEIWNSILGSGCHNFSPGNNKKEEFHCQDIAIIKHITELRN